MEYLKFKRISVNALCKETGLKQSTIHGQLVGPVMLSMDTVLAVINVFPDLSAEWLLRGNGQMEGIAQDADLKAVCIEQAKEILRLKLRIAELEGEKKLA